VTRQTIVVCDECYARRRDNDDQLVDRPIRMLDEFAENCHDSGSEGADIPIRANIQQQPTRKEG